MDEHPALVSVSNSDAQTLSPADLRSRRVGNGCQLSLQRLPLPPRKACLALPLTRSYHAERLSPCDPVFFVTIL